ncbi:hypothetical protein BDR05DRAFT_1045896 [Suillus weaverae]|nr:hypothetical protein BDR05DRAFT_1045896 [Suillus weaverae]
MTPTFGRITLLAGHRIIGRLHRKFFLGFFAPLFAVVTYLRLTAVRAVNLGLIERVRFAAAQEQKPLTTDRDKATRRDGRAQAQSVTAINVLLLGVSLFPYRGGTVYWTSQGVGSAALDDGVVPHEPISFERYIAASCVVGRWHHIGGVPEVGLLNGALRSLSSPLGTATDQSSCPRISSIGFQHKGYAELCPIHPKCGSRNRKPASQEDNGEGNQRQTGMT